MGRNRTGRDSKFQSIGVVRFHQLKAGGLSMRLPVIAASFFLLLQQPSVPGQQQPPKGTIEGVVLRVGTGEPVAEARVTLTKLTPAAAALLASGGTGPIDFAPPPPPPIAGAALRATRAPSRPL